MSDDYEDLLAPGESFKWSAIQATGHAMYRFSTTSNVKPFAKAGVGLYNFRVNYENGPFDDSASSSEFGFNLGAGMHVATQSNMMWGLRGTPGEFKSWRRRGCTCAATCHAGLSPTWPPSAARRK